MFFFYSGEAHRKLFDITTHIESMSLVFGSNELNVIHFCEWLPTCHLKTLSLHELGSCKVSRVSKALNAVPSLKTLDMKESKFTLKSMQAFASMLMQNQSLTKVDISRCSIDSTYACCLARALHCNTTLRTLEMSYNSIGERGTLAMAEMLKHNTTLTVLNMSSYNSVGERGALAMAEMLKHNTTLEVLNMSNAIIGVEGAKTLVKSVAMNHHLKTAHFRLL